MDDENDRKQSDNDTNPSGQPDSPEQDEALSIGSSRSKDRGRKGRRLKAERSTGTEKTRKGAEAGAGQRRFSMLDIRKKKFAIPIAILAVIVAATFAFSIGGGSPGGDSGVTPNGDSDSNGDSESASIKVGEVVKKGRFEASVLQVNPNHVPENPADAPGPGDKLVTIEFKLTNIDTAPVLVSSQAQFDIRDSRGRRYEVVGRGAPEPRFPDGVLAPGQTVQGWVAFEVPTSARGLSLLFDARARVV